MNADLYYDQSNYSSSLTLKSFVKNEQRSQEQSEQFYTKNSMVSKNSKNSSFASIVCQNIGKVSFSPIERNKKSRVLQRIHQNNQRQKEIASKITKVASNSVTRELSSEVKIPTLRSKHGGSNNPSLTRRVINSTKGSSKKDKKFSSKPPRRDPKVITKVNFLWINVANCD